jgi:HK97 gp10 family phage protein
MKSFTSLSAFVTHFVKLEVAVKHQAEHALHNCAKVITKTAKSELGYYQPGVGDFQAWSPLSERTLDYHDKMGVGESPELVTGELYASIEDEQHGGEAVSGTKLEIGKFQEFGTPEIPPRAFMGPAAVRSKAENEKIMAKAVVVGLIGGSALLGHEY